MCDKIDVHMGYEKMSLNIKRIPDGSNPSSFHQQVFTLKSTALRNITTGSPIQDTWQQPVISHVTEEILRLHNNTSEPVHVTKSQDLTTIF